MSLRTFVKISSVNNLSDARYCAGMSVDLIGFNLEPDSEKYVSPDSFRQITEWISGVEMVGEFEADEAQSINDRLKEYKVDFIQISHPHLLNEISMIGLPVILRIDIGNYTDQKELTEDLSYAKNMVKYFLIEGINDKIKEDELYSLATDFPFLIGSGISDKNVNELIDKYPVEGISLKGGDEIKPGYKDYDELGFILESIEIEDFE